MLKLKRRTAKRSNRRGAIIPLFAVLLPVILILCGFAVNLAYMQVVTTELKIATDCASHAGGRAMSVAQDDPTLTLPEKRALAVQWGMDKALELAATNLVLGRQLSVGEQGSGSDIEIGFGRSVRSNNGFGRYEYTPLETDEVADGDARPSSLQVSGNITVPLPFRVLSTSTTGGASSLSSFSPARRSVSTQINRDVALVLDRSGSMLHFHDEDLLDDTIDDLYNTWRGFRVYYYSSNPWSLDYYRWQLVEDGMPTPNHWDGPYGYWEERLISSSERNDGKDHVARRNFSDNLIYQLERWTNPNPTLGLQYSESFQNDSTQPDFDPADAQFAHGDRDDLTQPMAMYARDYEYVYNADLPGAPRFSRCALLYDGVDAFLDVLDLTVQEELVSLVTFSTTAQLDFDLQRSTDDDGQDPPLAQSYPNIRRALLNVRPGGGTAIGDGLLVGLPPLIPDPNDHTSIARPFAAKTIVVLTDGENTSGETSPLDAVNQVVSQENVTIHTVTFTSGADRAAMKAVAAAGRGRNYHDNDGSNLVAIFEEIANNLPTVLTE